MLRKEKVDFPFLLIVTILTISGFVIFLSAVMGITAKSEVKYFSILTNQLFLGLILGSVFAFIFSKLPIMLFRKYAFWAWIVSIILMLAVFIPGVGLHSGGATRWILLGPISFQPSEILKVTYILYLATMIASMGKNGIKTFKGGFVTFALISGITALPIIFQKDNDTMIVLMLAGTTMFWVAGARIKHLMILGLIAIVALGGLIMMRPYIKDRIVSFINPGEHLQTVGYQSQHSVTAIGSGGFAGRGFGQSLQKFTFLPEPVGDSIFAVAAEEFGFLGATFLIILFSLFCWRGLKIAGNIKDNFSRLVVVGVVILISVQAFWNMGTMMRVIPISGLPLPFVSHGGTALFFTLCACGILLNISRNQKHSN
ncbi:MAG: putative peptidoglycan glycosyltransferase FtsW [Candidatus Paceibacterota bacterium]